MKGKSLKDYLVASESHERLSLPEFITILIKVIKLVQKFHKLGYVHCDLEPENIFIDVVSESNDDSVAQSHRPKLMESSISALYSAKNIA